MHMHSKVTNQYLDLGSVITPSCPPTVCTARDSSRVLRVSESRGAAGPKDIGSGQWALEGPGRRVLIASARMC